MTGSITADKSLKRKRTMKSVHFASKVTVLETYSSEEYDRSEIFSAPALYKVNTSAIRSPSPQLSLSIEHCCPPGLVDGDAYEEDISSAEISPNTPPIISHSNYFSAVLSKKKKIRPTLSINTSMCADPLFFTKLSTDYKSDKTSSNTASNLLIPVSAIAL